MEALLLDVERYAGNFFCYGMKWTHAKRFRSSLPGRRGKSRYNNPKAGKKQAFGTDLQAGCLYRLATSFCWHLFLKEK